MEGTGTNVGRRLQEGCKAPPALRLSRREVRRIKGMMPEGRWNAHTVYRMKARFRQEEIATVDVSGTLRFQSL